MTWACIAPLEHVLAECDEQPAWLSAPERLRWTAFSTPARRRQFVAGRWLARRLWSRVAGGDAEGVLLGVDPEGRSSVPAPWGLSISHSGPWVGAALGHDGAVGFDLQVESPGRDWQALADFAGLHPCPDAHTFYRHWTLAEAWLKAHAELSSLTELRGLRWQARGDGPAWHGVMAGLHWACVGPSEPRWLTDLVPGSLAAMPGQAWQPDFSGACAPPR